MLLTGLIVVATSPGKNGLHWRGCSCLRPRCLDILSSGISDEGHVHLSLSCRQQGGLAEVESSPLNPPRVAPLVVELTVPRK